MLTDKYQPGQEPPPGSRATDDKGGSDMVARCLRDDVLTRVQQPRPLADEAGLTMTTTALARVLHNPNVSAAIVGASRPDQVTHNAQAADVTLDDDLVARIDSILDPVVERDPTKIDRFPERP